MHNDDGTYLIFHKSLRTCQKNSVSLGEEDGWSRHLSGFISPMTLGSIQGRLGGMGGAGLRSWK